MFALHVRDDFTSKVNGAKKIEVDGFAPVFEAGGEKALGRRTSGVGDTNVDGSELLYYGLDKMVDGGWISDVEGFEKHFRVVLFSNLFGGLLQGFFIAGAHGDAAAFGGKGFGGGAAKSLAGSGDDRNPIFESGFHGDGL